MVSVQRLHELFWLSGTEQLFQRPCEGLPDLTLAGDEKLRVLTRDNLSAEGELVNWLLNFNASNAAYLHAVRCGRVVGFFILHRGKVVHFAFLFLQNRMNQILGLPPDVARIGHAYTVPAYRGKGCQGRSILARAAYARELGYSAIAAETRPDNVASQNGMKKAGMELRGEVQFTVILRCLVIRWQRPAGMGFLGWCTVR